MARDYGAEYQARVEAAQERGWDSFYAEREGRREAREQAEDWGVDWDSAQIEAYAEFERDFGEGVYDRDALRDIFDEFYPDGNDDDFWDWLAELYG
jgi:hypothetical protein